VVCGGKVFGGAIEIEAQHPKLRAI